VIFILIISHRGLWYKPEEKNTKQAFMESFKHGYGTETDFRDCQSKLVISHDMPNGSEMTAEEFFELYKSYKIDEPLALNIKADGLNVELLKLLTEYEISNYFVFDMSIPDSLSYLKTNMKTYTRQSEYEAIPAYYDKACGVWLDEFHHHWIHQETINNHLNHNKTIALVSPDLHKRDYTKEWEEYKRIDKNLNGSKKIILCTDFPLEATKFFG
jgi:glycerophosphoryl diester phosphodiesterase